MSAGPRTSRGGLIVAVWRRPSGLQVARERRYPEVALAGRRAVFLVWRRGRPMALSYKSLLADVSWIRAIRYFAATRLKERRSSARICCYPLLDVSTSLDPFLQHRLSLRRRVPGGARTAAGTCPQDLAVALLDKGFAQHPDGGGGTSYDKGFINYWTYPRSQDRRSLVRRSGQGAGISGWLPGLAGYMLAQGGDRRSSRFLFQQIAQWAEHEYMLQDRGAAADTTRHPRRAWTR